MKNFSFSEDKASFCYEDVCINTSGKIAKAVTFGLAAVVIITGIASLFDSASN